jgi:hypothetical protein
MARIRCFVAVLLTCCMGTNTGAQINPATHVFVGSTPGDSLIKTLLQIPAATVCDFIRWKLVLTDGGNDANTFTLDISYGESQPNTLGFKGGGQEHALAGTYTVTKHKAGSPQREIYRLKLEKQAAAISFLKVNDNLLHVLTPDGKLLVGNGGWSYTLNRNEPLMQASPVLPLLATASVYKDTSRRVTFEGRSPCRDLATQYNLNAGSDCIKLKWRLILYRDTTTFLPTTYSLDRTLSRRHRIEGKWRVVKGFGANADAVVYQLDPDKPDSSLSFLAGDENVLFFIDKNNQLFTGDRNFSYTLNKR